MESTSQPQGLPVSLLTSCDTSAFKTEVLASFYKDGIGELCQTDEAILQYGRRTYDKLKGKQDKKAEVKRTVMADMRRLAYLYANFKEKCDEAQKQSTRSADLLICSNFEETKEAIRLYTNSDGAVKAGLKSQLYYLIKRFAKIMKAAYVVRDDDDKAAEVDKSVQVLELHHLEVFGDATYQLNMKRQEKLWRPQELPGEGDVEKMKQYTVMRMSNMLADEYLLWDFHSFAKLRDLVVSRLTLFNVRRGGEPARLTLMQWMDAENNSWLDKTRTEAFANDLHCNQFQEMKVTFQGGKGNNYVVPVLFHTIQGTRKLVEVRNQAGIPEETRYAFPYTQASLNHVSGLHSVKRITT